MTKPYYKELWDIIGPSVEEAVKYFLAQESSLDILTQPLYLCTKGVNWQYEGFWTYLLLQYIAQMHIRSPRNKMKQVLPTFVSENQVAFVDGRWISKNIILAHEPVCHYHRKNLSPRSSIKIDLMKAFDSLDMQLLNNIMQAMNFLAAYRN